MKVSPKNESEIATMLKAGTLLRESLDATKKFVEIGMTTMEVNAFFEKYVEERGGFPGFKTVDGYSWGTCICINDQIVHTPPSSKIIEDGDVITIDAGVMIDGLHTDSAITYQIGTQNPEVQRFLDAGLRALDNAMKMAIVGNNIGHISQEYEKVMEKEGYSIVPQLTGHGIGYELHEDPFVPCFLDRPVEKTMKLVKGMTLALEIMYSMGGPRIETEADDWSIRMVDGSISATHEHTIMVDEKKPFILA